MKKMRLRAALLPLALALPVAAAAAVLWALEGQTIIDLIQVALKLAVIP